MSAYAALDGFNDALHYSRQGADAFTWNEHLTLTAQRIVFVLCGALATQVIIYQFGVLALAWGLVFSFWHNLSYYYGRHKIDPNQPFSLTYSSATSSAKVELGFRVRAVFAVVGYSLLLFLLWA